MKRILSLLLSITLLLLLPACGSSTAEEDDSGGSGHAFDYGGGVTLRILSGSENQELEEILDAFARQENINIEMTYQGSLDIMRTLQGETVDYDAVWPASSLWLTAGDTQYRVKHAQSISITPVIFGIRQSLAEELGFVGREVSVSDLLNAIPPPPSPTPDAAPMLVSSTPCWETRMSSRRRICRTRPRENRLQPCSPGWTAPRAVPTGSRICSSWAGTTPW